MTLSLRRIRGRTQTKDLNEFNYHEPLTVEVTDLSPGDYVQFTVARTPSSDDAMIRRSMVLGAGQTVALFVIPREQVELALDEGVTVYHNVWLKSGAEEQLIVRGELTPAGSIKPDFGDAPTTAPAAFTGPITFSPSVPVDGQPLDFTIPERSGNPIPTLGGVGAKIDGVAVSLIDLGNNTWRIPSVSGSVITVEATAQNDSRATIAATIPVGATVGTADPAPQWSGALAVAPLTLHVGDTGSITLPQATNATARVLTSLVADGANVPFSGPAGGPYTFTAPDADTLEIVATATGPDGSTLITAVVQIREALANPAAPTAVSAVFSPPNPTNAQAFAITVSATGGTPVPGLFIDNPAVSLDKVSADTWIAQPQAEGSYTFNLRAENSQGPVTGTASVSVSIAPAPVWGGAMSFSDAEPREGGSLDITLPGASNALSRAMVTATDDSVPIFNDLTGGAPTYSLDLTGITGVLQFTAEAQGPGGVTVLEGEITILPALAAPSNVQVSISPPNPSEGQSVTVAVTADGEPAPGFTLATTLDGTAQNGGEFVSVAPNAWTWSGSTPGDLVATVTATSSQGSAQGSASATIGAASVAALPTASEIILEEFLTDAPDGLGGTLAADPGNIIAYTTAAYDAALPDGYELRTSWQAAPLDPATHVDNGWPGATTNEPRVSGSEYQPGQMVEAYMWLYDDAGVLVAEGWLRKDGEGLLGSAIEIAPRAVAPVFTAQPTASKAVVAVGETVTFSLGTTEGGEVPTGTLFLGMTDVTSAMNGLSYTATGDGELRWVVEATNGAGTTAASVVTVQVSSGGAQTVVLTDPYSGATAEFRNVLAAGYFFGPAKSQWWFVEAPGETAVIQYLNPVPTQRANRERSSSGAMASAWIHGLALNPARDINPVPYDETMRNPTPYSDNLPFSNASWPTFPLSSMQDGDVLVKCIGEDSFTYDFQADGQDAPRVGLPKQWVTIHRLATVPPANALAPSVVAGRSRTVHTADVDSIVAKLKNRAAPAGSNPATYAELSRSIQVLDLGHALRSKTTKKGGYESFTPFRWVGPGQRNYGQSRSELMDEIEWQLNTNLLTVPQKRELVASKVQWGHAINENTDFLNLDGGHYQGTQNGQAAAFEATGQASRIGELHGGGLGGNWNQIFFASAADIAYWDQSHTSGSLPRWSFVRQATAFQLGQTKTAPSGASITAIKATLVGKQAGDAIHDDYSGLWMYGLTSGARALVWRQRSVHGQPNQSTWSIWLVQSTLQGSFQAGEDIRFEKPGDMVGYHWRQRQSLSTFNPSGLTGYADLNRVGCAGPMKDSGTWHPNLETVFEFLRASLRPDWPDADADYQGFVSSYQRPNGGVSTLAIKCCEAYLDEIAAGTQTNEAPFVITPASMPNVGSVGEAFSYTIGTAGGHPAPSSHVFVGFTPEAGGPEQVIRDEPGTSGGTITPAEKGSYRVVVTWTNGVGAPANSIATNTINSGSAAGGETIDMTAATSSIMFNPHNVRSNGVLPPNSAFVQQPLADSTSQMAMRSAAGGVLALIYFPKSIRNINEFTNIAWGGWAGTNRWLARFYGDANGDTTRAHRFENRFGSDLMRSVQLPDDDLLFMAWRRDDASQMRVDLFQTADGTKLANTGQYDQETVVDNNQFAESSLKIGEYFPGSIVYVIFYDGNASDATLAAIAQGADPTATLTAAGHTVTYNPVFDGTVAGLQSAAGTWAAASFQTANEGYAKPGSDHQAAFRVTGIAEASATAPLAPVYGYPIFVHPDDTSTDARIFVENGPGAMEARCLIEATGAVHVDWTSIGTINGTGSGTLTIPDIEEAIVFQVRGGGTTVNVREPMFLAYGHVDSGQSQKTQVGTTGKEGYVQNDANTLGMTVIENFDVNGDPATPIRINMAHKPREPDFYRAKLDQLKAYRPNRRFADIEASVQGRSPEQLQSATLQKSFLREIPKLNAFGRAKVSAWAMQHATSGWAPNSGAQTPFEVMSALVDGVWPGSVGYPIDHHIMGEVPRARFCITPASRHNEGVHNTTRTEQVEWCNQNGHAVGPPLFDYPVQADNVHPLFNGKASERMGAREAVAIARAFGWDTTVNPHFLTATLESGGAIMRITLGGFNGGSLRSDTPSDLAGFQINTGSGWSSTGFTASIDGNDVILTKTSGTWSVGIEVRFLANGAPNSADTAVELTLAARTLYCTVDIDVTGDGWPVSGTMKDYGGSIGERWIPDWSVVVD